MTPTRLLFILLGALVANSSIGQVVYPARAESMDVEIRYRIRADRDERVRQFRVLDAHLKNLKFVAFPKVDADLDITDATAERFSGTIPSATVLDTLIDPHVQQILFAPTGYKYPDSLDKPVSVRFALATGLRAADQQRLHGQVVGRLEQMGFREAVGYDHRGYTMVRGDIPYGNLGRLVKDLRREPAGWFLPDSPPELLPVPIRNLLPVRWVEVVPDADFTFLQAMPPAPGRAIFTPDLRAVLDDPTAKGKPLRVEIVLDRPADDVVLARLRTRLRVNYGATVVNPRTNQPELVGATVEGVVGPVVTLYLPNGSQAEQLVAEPGVMTVRLPRAAVETVSPVPQDAGLDPPSSVLAATRFVQLHQVGYRGKGTRIAVVASEFPGAAALIGKDLPANTQVVDLTAEMSPTLEPLPPIPNRASGGIAAALAAHAAAPDAQLVLVRIDPTAFFQLHEVARFFRGNVEYTSALQARVTELAARSEDLRRQYLAAVAEYQRAFAVPGDDPNNKVRRDLAAKNLELISRERDLLAVWAERAGMLRAAMKGLNGVTVVVNTLVWETGYQLDGLSEVSQAIDHTFAGEAELVANTRSATRPRFVPRTLWVQAASPSAGSLWGGPYLDGDGNGAMEFAPPNYPIPTGNWTRELNFLAVRSSDGMISPTIPEKSRVRLTVQWREPHDVAAYGGNAAMSPLTLRVLRQLDPAGNVRASDELEEVARSLGGPYRVAKEPTYVVYEQIVEFDAAVAGAYCLRVEGVTGYDPILPALKPQLEINPRLYVEFVGAAPTAGRPIFASFASRNAGVGIPGDAKGAMTIGAGDRPDGSGFNGVTGGGTGISLLVKPELTIDGNLDTGTRLRGPGVAAGFGGGATAVLIGGGLPPNDLFRATGMKSGGPLVLPESWLKLLTGR